jgi:hypothetical protein
MIVVESLEPHDKDCKADLAPQPEIFTDGVGVYADYYCSNEGRDPNCQACLRVFIGKLPDPEQLPCGENCGRPQWFTADSLVPSPED